MTTHNKFIWSLKRGLSRRLYYKSETYHINLNNLIDLYALLM